MSLRAIALIAAALGSLATLTPGVAAAQPSAQPAARPAVQDARIRAGAPVSAIGRAVERQAKQDGFAVVRGLCGHVVGRAIHEELTIVIRQGAPQVLTAF